MTITMQSFAMLETRRCDNLDRDRRYYVDGKPVPREEFQRIREHAKIEDCFSTMRKGMRFHYRHEARI